MDAAQPPPIECVSPHVVDGDSIDCGTERLHLIGIDAPELHGCPKGRECVPGNPKWSKRSLERALKYGPFRYRIISRDRSGDAAVVATAGRVNLSCWQLSRSQARYKPQWDTGGQIARACR
jgi:endonuclease YncB( thermonuclease family)